MNAASSHRSWLRDFHGGYLLEGYTLTLVRGLTPQEFLDRVGADPAGDYDGFEAFAARDREFQEDQTDWGDFMFVGVTRLQGKDADWVLALEINGGVEIQTDGMKDATRGTRAVSHFRSPNAMTLFSWWEDGELRTRFEGAQQREGTTPDDLVDLMVQVGFDLESGACDLEEYVALADALTGVHVTATMLENGTYSTGIVEVPAQD